MKNKILLIGLVLSLFACRKFNQNSDPNNSLEPTFTCKVLTATPEMMNQVRDRAFRVNQLWIQEMAAKKGGNGGGKPVDTTHTSTGGGGTTGGTSGGGTTGGGTTSNALVFYLDFDGAKVSNTSWNWNGDLYLNPSGMTAAAQQEVFQNVVDDYSPFNVVVTMDSTVFANANPYNRQRCIITTSWEWYGKAGGVAYINSSNWGDGTPCFVFSSLLNYNTKYIKEATSHECGHTAGLDHQAQLDSAGNLIATYYGGAGTDQYGFAPIMGVGYYKPIVNWYVGTTPYNAIQNDWNILLARIGLVQDDYSDIPNSAAANYSSTINGVLNNPTDVDYISVPLTALSVSIATNQFVPSVNFVTPGDGRKYVVVKAIQNPWVPNAIGTGKYTVTVQ